MLRTIVPAAAAALMAVVELRAGAARLRLLPAAGGRITSCALLGPDGRPHAVLHPYPEDHTDLDRWAKGGLYPLLPYSGRIRAARLLFGGRTWALTPYPGSPHTLHGIAQRRAWALCEHGSDHARLRYVHAPDGHWPWAFEADMVVQLAPTRVCVEITLRNTGDVAMPGGIGLHPYFAHHAGDHVVYDAGPAWPFDGDYLALAPPADAMRAQPQSLAAALPGDADLTRFHAGWTGALRVLSAGGDMRLRLHGDAALNQLVLHRPAGSPYLCAEPVSHVADGFNLHARGQSSTGTRVLAAGERVCGRVEILGG